MFLVYVNFTKKPFYQQMYYSVIVKTITKFVKLLILNTIF